MKIEQKITNWEYIFYECDKIIEIEFINFYTKTITNMSTIFLLLYFKNLNLNNFDTKNVTNMWRMFSHCSSLKNLNLNN